MKIKRGDLVACYITNSSEWETLMSWGIVLDINENLDDLLVLDNTGHQRWWPCKRWRVLSSKKEIKNLDIKVKLA